MTRKVVAIKQTCFASPELYEGELDTGEYFYARCRWGHCRLDIPHGKMVASIQYEDPLKGCFEKGELKKLFAQADIELDEDLLIL